MFTFRSQMPLKKQLFIQIKSHQLPRELHFYRCNALFEYMTLRGLEEKNLQFSSKNSFNNSFMGIGKRDNSREKKASPGSKAYHCSFILIMRRYFSTGFSEILNNMLITLHSRR
jgi:hypothetical protein